MNRSPLAASLAIAVVGCTARPADPVAPSMHTPPPVPTAASGDDAAGLHVDLRIAAARVSQIRDLHATVTLTNRAPQPRRLQLGYMCAGNLVLEVVDPSGQRVPPLSPPVPFKEDGVTGWGTLAPGASRSFECDSGIGIDAPAGHYRVRFQGVPTDPIAGSVRSDWVGFDVGP